MPFLFLQNFISLKYAHWLLSSLACFNSNFSFQWRRTELLKHKVINYMYKLLSLNIKITFDITTMNFTTKVLKPDNVSPTNSLLQYTENSEYSNWTFKKFTKFRNSDQDGSLILTSLWKDNKFEKICTIDNRLKGIGNWRCGMTTRKVGTVNNVSLNFQLND